MKNTLAFDLGTTAGWAASVDGSISSGIATFKNSRYEGGGMRYLRFRQFVENMIMLCEPEQILFEEVRRHEGTDAAHVYGGMLAQLTAIGEEQDIPYLGIPVGTIKKAATGNGRANKEKVMAAVQDYGHEPFDDNEADALAILLFTSRPS